MGNYFYHGIEAYFGAMGEIVQTMIKILKEGILLRNKIIDTDDNKLNHVCLYKKNEDYFYSESDSLINSARGGWIDGCFVFVINPNIDAKKAVLGQDTNLVDEWRCYHDIPVSDIVAIALPFEYIDECLECDYEDEDLVLLKNGLSELKAIAEQLSLPIYDSCRKNFTDEIDSTNNIKIKGK